MPGRHRTQTIRIEPTKFQAAIEWLGKQDQAYKIRGNTVEGTHDLIRKMKRENFHNKV